jgi:hypothetical protein
MVQIEFTGDRLRYIKFQIRYSLPEYLIEGGMRSPFEVNEGELTLLAYMVMYKEAAVETFLSHGHSKSQKSVENYLSGLRKKGLVVGKEINPDLYISLSPEGHVYTFKLTD